VAQSSQVDKEGLRALGARGVVFVGEQGIQLVFGARAQFIAKAMDSLRV
jgi:PTS system D-glucosamine-specific IIC component